MNEIRTDLMQYIQSCILPLYNHFDKGHSRQHALDVIDESLALAQDYSVNKEMVYTIAAYHDTGLTIDREKHHVHSGEILSADKMLLKWFTEEQVETMRQAVEDHRASSKHEPRSIYGKIVAEADRNIIPEQIVRRTMQYGLKQNPEGSFDWHFKRTCEHLQAKYAEGGYIKLYLHSPKNEAGLTALRCLINHKTELRNICIDIYSAKENTQNIKK